MCNMAVESLALNAVFPPDERAIEYVKQVSNSPFTPVESDADAEYESRLRFDLTDMEPFVAAPGVPSNGQPVHEFIGTKINQAFIGTCSNSRIEDLRVAAKILKGKTVHPGVRMIVTPASYAAYFQAREEGLLQIFEKSKVLLTASECGICTRPSLATGEVCISSGNRNFPGRMGNRDAQIFLGSPATVAASAIGRRDRRSEGVSAIMKRNFTGKVWKFGDCIDSGNIKGVMAGIDPEFHSKVKPGDFIVAGINFGMGSSAEDAPRSLRDAGIAAVLAESISNIYLRTLINLGLPAIECRGHIDSCRTRRRSRSGPGIRQSAQSDEWGCPRAFRLFQIMRSLFWRKAV